MNSETEKPIIVRYGDSKRPVKIPYDIEAKDSYDASCRLNTPGKLKLLVWNFETLTVVWQTCWREIICTSVGNRVIWLSLTGPWPCSTVLAHCYHWICIFNTQILRDVCSYLEFTDNDLVFKILCKLQDGLKVTAHDATEALKQYRRFQGEIGRLQCTINRPCVSKLCRVLR